MLPQLLQPRLRLVRQQAAPGLYLDMLLVGEPSAVRNLQLLRPGPDGLPAFLHRAESTQSHQPGGGDQHEDAGQLVE